MRNTSWLIVVTACGIVGCAGPEVECVQGRVTLDAVPMPEVSVLFWPERDPHLGILAGDTDDEGAFAIRPVVEQGQGKAGDYIVSVSDAKNRMAIIAMVLSGATNMTLPDGRRLPPLKYWNVETSPLRATVQHGVTDLSPFELTSKP